MRAWYLIYSKPRQEALAVKNLDRQSYEVYLPRLRQMKRVRGRYGEFVEPMFPRYLFIHLDDETDNWKPIRSTLGVSGMVAFGGQPARVPDDLISTLRNRAAADGIHVVRPRQLARGDRVRIVAGSLSGYEAIFEASSGRERVLLLLDFAGRRVSIQIARNAVEAIC